MFNFNNISFFVLSQLWKKYWYTKGGIKIIYFKFWEVTHFIFAICSQCQFLYLEQVCLRNKISLSSFQGLQLKPLNGTSVCKLQPVCTDKVASRILSPVFIRQHNQLTNYSVVKTFVFSYVFLNKYVIIMFQNTIAKLCFQT